MKKMILFSVVSMVLASSAFAADISVSMSRSTPSGFRSGVMGAFRVNYSSGKKLDRVLIDYGFRNKLGATCDSWQSPISDDASTRNVPMASQDGVHWTVDLPSSATGGTSPEGIQLVYPGSRNYINMEFAFTLMDHGRRSYDNAGVNMGFYSAEIPAYKGVATRDEVLRIRPMSQASDYNGCGGGANKTY